MNSADVIGYVYDGEVNCPDCQMGPDQDGTDPIFADQESDTPMHCSACGIPLGNPLTDAGIEYVVRAIAKEWARGPDLEGRRAQSANGPAWYVESPGGSVVADWARDLELGPMQCLADDVAQWVDAARKEVSDAPERVRLWVENEIREELVAQASWEAT